MLKQCWLTCTCFLALAGFTFASDLPGTTNAAYQRADTLDNRKKDTLKNNTSSIPADPKLAFKDMAPAEDDLDISSISISDLNPLAVSFVEEYRTKFTETLEDIKDKGRPHFEMMDLILDKYELPRELKYLAVIESYLKTGARSRAGAVGPWQFMPATARYMGLRITRKTDERKDLYKSTHAASKYLNMLYKMYGDWLLVIAAYNCGPGKVNSAIKKSGSSDFWTMQQFLPLESRNHVKKFIATHYILEGCGGPTTLTKEETAAWQFANTIESKEEVSADSRVQSISGRYIGSVIARHIRMDIAAFNKINPHFDRLIADNGKYELRLPAEKMDLFTEKKSAILEESILILLNNSAAAR